MPSKRPRHSSKSVDPPSSRQNSKPRPRRTQTPQKTLVYKEYSSDEDLSSLDKSQDFRPSDDDAEKNEEKDLDSDHLDSDLEEQAQPSKKKIKKLQGTLVKKIADGPTEDQMPPPGLIASFTMDFLNNLTKPECNDREWLNLNDKTYRKALQNWKDFVDYLVPKLMECDWTLPKLPSKDLVHRLHRDVRFSNDKTPYKKYFSAGFSRTGKKGPWAGYYLHIQPGDRSLLAGGIWTPEKNELATIRSSILRSSKPLRDVINDEKFIKMFGKPEEGKGKNKRQSIFGHEDSLKNCPKLNGVDTSHPDISLLKLKTIGAEKYFSDELVLSSGFVDEVVKTFKILTPLIQCLNNMILPELHVELFFPNLKTHPLRMQDLFSIDCFSSLAHNASRILRKTHSVNLAITINEHL
ncbi:hypothetical protein O181_019395 [Austropuccinia psidii MF-1]|uniref:Uncharacterized protein n=1 Tax=Austropuccinia psidii MF-1 TaxID=1389203 RepID=A0A9Q3GV02_9BASI|nr:hypothetical protein [Austropuccinia psidii MF-1]